MNTLTLTPNQRLAATLIKRYNEEKITQGFTCWPSADIRPFSSWIQELWDQVCAQRIDLNQIPLTADQELILWEEIIAAEPGSDQLLMLSDLAKQAQSAWTTLKLWRTRFDHPSFSFTENARHFQAWAEAFEQRCHEQDWIDRASLTDHLIDALRQTSLHLPQKLILLNFTELAPQYRELLAVCEKQGLSIEYQNLQQGRSQYQIKLIDEEQELQTVARWAKKILAEKPTARIGCIAADLEDKRETILSCFNEVFPSPDYYNISAGRTLASYPVIQQALMLLKLPLQTLSSDTTTALLHSPFVGDAETEMLPRIQADRDLRYRNLNSLSWNEFLAELEKAACGSLSLRLKTYLKKCKLQPSSQNISLWLCYFAEQLEVLGWPGEKSLNSVEYQVVSRWLELLHDTQQLELVLDKVSASKALRYLTVLAAKTYFQPESPEAPVQILGQLEGAGLPFDYLWVLGLDDTAWPEPPSPNPLLPQELQRSLGMPNACAERQLNYSRRLTQQYQEAAPEVFFSYLERSAKEELRPSPLIAHLEIKTAADLHLPFAATQLQTLFYSQKLEQVRDECAPSLQTGEKIRGGASLFEKQALCPFKAFAELRLGARSLEEPQAGLPAKSRGSVIHHALELFWKEVKNQQNLLALSPAQLEAKIEQVLKSALSKLAPFIHPEALYHSLLQRRLQALLLNWLELEKTRPPFKVIALEQKQEIHLADFPITLRVDRIDELEGGEHLIIDYKTKKNCDTSAWFGQRLDEPQLPLYCLTQGNQVTGLAFAQLHPNRIEMKGLTRTELNLDGLKILNEKTKADALSWEAQLEQWRINLKQLLIDFQNGLAAVDPKKGRESCRHCDLQTLCRIHEDLSYSYDQTNT